MLNMKSTFSAFSYLGYFYICCLRAFWNVWQIQASYAVPGTLMEFELGLADASGYWANLGAIVGRGS